MIFFDLFCHTADPCRTCLVREFRERNRICCSVAPQQKKNLFDIIQMLLSHKKLVAQVGAVLSRALAFNTNLTLTIKSSSSILAVAASV